MPQKEYSVAEWANKFKLDKNIDMPSLAKQRDKNVCKNLRKQTVMVFANKNTADKFISKRIKNDSIDLNKLSYFLNLLFRTMI